MDDFVKRKYLQMDLEKWNKILYRDEAGNPEKDGLSAEELWNEFQIKSAPKFGDACWSHIPHKWADDVRQFISAVQKELGDRIEFEQIKEKFCQLTVYFSAKDDEAKKRVRGLQTECIDRLVFKGVHPKLRG